MADNNPQPPKKVTLAPQKPTVPSFRESRISMALNSDVLWLLLLFIVVILRYPAATFMPMSSNIPARQLLEFFVHSAVGMFALGVLLCNLRWFKSRPPLFPSILMGIIATSTLLHAFVGGDELVFEGLMLVALPLIAFLQYRNIVKLFPWFVAIIWCVDAFHIFDWLTYDYFPRVCGGNWSVFWKHWFDQVDNAVSIAGNRNWQAAFVGATTPFACWAGWRIVSFFTSPGSNRLSLNILVQTIIIGLGVFMYIPLNSRASVVSLCLAGALFAVIFAMRYFRSDRKLLYRVLGGVVIIGALLGGGIGFFCNDYVQGKFENFSKDDVRVPMWRAATHLIFETHGPVRETCYPPQNPNIRWMTGIGSKYFEDEYMTYRGPDYFTRKVAANRTDFPHNHTFYVASYIGVPAAIAWLILALLPLTATFLRLITTRRLRWHWMLAFWCVIVLLTHAQLDLIMEYWPMAAFLTLSLGILWRLTWPAKLCRIRPFSRLIAEQAYLPLAARGVVLLGGIAMLCASCYFATTMLRANFYRRDVTVLSEMLRTSQSPAEAVRYALQIDHAASESAKIYPFPDVAYQGLTAALILPPHISGPAMDFYLDMMFNKTGRYNYCDINLFESTRLTVMVTKEINELRSLVPQKLIAATQAGTDTAAAAKIAEVDAKIAAIIAPKKDIFDRIEAALLRQARVYPVGYRGWVSLRDHYRTTGRFDEADFCDEQVRRVMNIKGMIVPRQFKEMPFAELIASPQWRTFTEQQVAASPSFDLRPWDADKTPGLVWREPARFPTYDSTTWPDMKFVDRRLGPNRTYKLDIENDPSIAAFKVEKAAQAVVAELKKAEAAAAAKAKAADGKDTAPIAPSMPAGA